MTTDALTGCASGPLSPRVAVTVIVESGTGAEGAGATCAPADDDTMQIAIAPDEIPGARNAIRLFFTVDLPDAIVARLRRAQGASELAAASEAFRRAADAGRPTLSAGRRTGPYGRPER